MSKKITPAAYDSKIEGNVTFTKLDTAINWMRSNSLWPMPMGLACCGIELMATQEPHGLILPDLVWRLCVFHRAKVMS